MGKTVLIGEKKLQYYKGLLIRSDLGLHDQIAGVIKEILPNGGRILDLGAGQGALSLRLHDLGYDVLAVDIDPGDFKCQEVPFYKVNFNSSDEVAAFIVKYRDSFDLVIGVEVIEHVENPWEYVRTLKSLAKKGGHILISTPNVTNWFSRFVFLFTGQFHQFREADLEYGHIAPITSYHLGVILARENMTDISVRSGGTLPRFWLQADRYMLFFNFLNLFFYPFMKRIKKGWCIITTARKA